MAVSDRSDCDSAESAESYSPRVAADDREATSSAFASDVVNALAAMDLVDSYHAVDTPFSVNLSPKYRNLVAILLLDGQSWHIEMMECHSQCHHFHYD